MVNYNEEELNFVKSISLTHLASSMGYTVIKRGHYHILKEMDSLTIYNDRTWYRWSGKGDRKGGSTIDFLLEFGNLSHDITKNKYLQAIEYLLEFGGYNNLDKNEVRNIIKKSENIGAAPERKKEMIMPPKNENGFRRLYAYLIQKRGISVNTINFFIKNKLLYEDNEHHNLVFVAYDKNNEIKFATKRGTSDLNGYRYRGDVEGNDKNYGVNIVNKSSSEVNVFEACIDMMSYCDLKNDLNATNKLALSMLSDAPLETFLNENLQINKINLWLDNDEPGRNAAQRLENKYREKGFIVTNNIVPEGKDINEYLILTQQSISINKSK